MYSGASPTENPYKREMVMNAKLAAVQSEFYYVLSMGWHLPTEELAAEVASGAFRQHMLELIETAREMNDAEDDWDEALLQMHEIWKEASAAEEFHGLRIEYTRLFSTPKKSVHRLYEALARGKSKMLFENPVAKHAEDCYRRAGLRIEHRQQEPADYLPTELEFASVLLTELATELTGEDKILPISQEECAALWQEFYQEHLAGWLGEFWQAVAADTTSECYRRLALTGAVLLKKEW